MPVYDYWCNHCKIGWEAVAVIKDRFLQPCPGCGKAGELRITTRSRPQVYEYYDEGLGSHVTGPKHRRTIMKQKNLEEL